MANHTFNTDIACEVGLESAIILENIYFWCKKNEANGKLVKGKPFTFNTVKAFGEIFYYMTSSTISRSLRKLEETGFIESGVFNAKAWDRTKWYCVTQKTKEYYEPKPIRRIEDSIVQNEEMQSTENEQCSFQKEEMECDKTEDSNFQKSKISITDINTNNKPNINTDITTSERACEENKNLSNVGEIQKYTYNAIATHNANSEVSRKIPISNSLISFVQKEFRELLEEHRDSLNEVKTAIDHYILVSESDTWKKFYGWRDFIKNFNSYTSEYFDIHKFVNEPKQTTQKEVSAEYSESLTQEREDLAEKERIQHLKDIYDDFTPIRKEFVKALFAMYQENGLYQACTQDRFNLEFAEVADELSNVSSKVLKARFEDYFKRSERIEPLKAVVAQRLINLEE